MSAFEFEGHEALIAQLRAGTFGAPDHLHRRVLAGAPARRRRIAAMSARRRFFIALPVAASIAVVAAVVNGVFFTSSSHPTPFNAAGVVAHGHAPGPAGPYGPPGPTGATGAAGPTGQKGPTGAYDVHRFATGAKGATGAGGLTGAAGSTETPATSGSLKALAATSAREQAQSAAPHALNIPKGRLTHADANLQVEVANCGALTTATNKATAIVTQLGGYSQRVQYRASQKCAGSAYLDLRVPLSKTEAAITRLGGLGHLISQSVSTEDRQQQFTRQTSEIGQLQRQIAVYEQELQSGTLTSAQQVAVQMRLAQAKRELTGTRKARIQTVKSGTTADITLFLTTKRDAVAVARPHKTGRLGQMLHNMIEFLAVEGIVVLYILLIAGPILLVGGLIWWFTLGRRRRDEKELLAQGA